MKIDQICIARCFGKMHFPELTVLSMQGALVDFVYLCYISALRLLRCHNISSKLD